MKIVHKLVKQGGQVTTACGASPKMNEWISAQWGSVTCSECEKHSELPKSENKETK